jgi:beta-galactosidase/beta-glucuronidase
MPTENAVPRPEHPKPQFQRAAWINLNGRWTYALDPGKSGMHEGRRLYESRGFSDEITVPFCPESALSGVGHTDFIEAMWYHRRIEIPQEWSGKSTILHFGGVDYECEAFVDGVSVGTHYGGTVSFSFDITRQVKAGGCHNLVVRVLDEQRTAGQPRGKQCNAFKSQSCSYTRTTGIWQTVWLEAVPQLGLRDCRIIPDFDGRRFIFMPQYRAGARGLSFRVTVRAGDEVVGCGTGPCADDVPVVVELPNPKFWGPGNPFLYDVVLEVTGPDGMPLDEVRSYGGLRKIHVEGDRLFLNNEPLYVRFVLDQGFYPDGVWTAPSDEALKRDIQLAMAAGFNGARLHQKVFEERFHYWADRLGYLTWGESASWGCNVNRFEDARNFLSEWREIVLRDRNHPSIIAWTPFNETLNISNPGQHHRLHRDAYELTKALDPTRPVNDASGYIHVQTDIWSVHHYDRPDTLRDSLSPGTDDGVFHRWPEHEVKYEGQPYIVDEFGGIKWVPKSREPHADNTWGYGDDPKSEEEFYCVLEAEVDIVLGTEKLSGYCYTQLTDVEQEQNGIYFYDRSPKFDMKRIAGIFGKEPEARPGEGECDGR